MSFTQHLQLLLDPASTLPLQLDLGRYSCSWENGKFKITQSQQPGFRTLERDELLQLMRRLHAAPHAVLLNLNGHFFGESVMQGMAAPMTALSKLQALVLSRTCPPDPPTGNSIRDAGCIALSSSLVHLSHLKVLDLSCKFVVWSGASVVNIGFWS